MNLSSIRIALRGIVANKLRSFLTTLGIAIGVGSVIVLVAVGSGSAVGEPAEPRSARVEHAHGALRRLRLRRAGRNAEPALLDHRQRRDGAGEQGQRARRLAGRARGQREHETVVYNGATDTPSTISGTTTNFSSVRNYPVQWGSWFTQQQYDTHADVVVLGLTDVKDLVGQHADRLRARRPAGADRWQVVRRDRRVQVEGHQRLPGPGQHRDHAAHDGA